MEKYPFGHTYLVHKIAVVVSEFFLVAFACKIALSFGWWKIGGPTEGTVPIFALSWVGINALARLYDPEYIFDFKRYSKNSWYALLPQLIFIAGYIFSLDISYFPILFLVPFYLTSLTLVMAFRWLIGVSYQNRRRLFRNHKVLIIGSGKTADDLFEFFISKRTPVFRYSGLIDENGAVSSYKHDTEKTIEEIKEICIQNQIDEIYSALPLQESLILESLSNFADNHHIRFKLASSFDFLRKTDISVSFFDQTPIITLQNDPLASWVNRLVKRCFDVAFSTVILLTIFPLIYLVIGTLIRLESKGPIFFKQLRAGKKNTPFLCYKFRTMYVHQEEAEYKQATKNDPRITKVGAFLRKTNLDEFPQFINVFLGHMSVVGPRPHPFKLNDLYAPIIDKYDYRHLITPGITGHAQINGFRGETKDQNEMEKRIEYDNWYIRNWTLGLDMYIVVQTVFKTMIGDQNAY